MVQLINQDTSIDNYSQADNLGLSRVWQLIGNSSNK